MSNSLGALLLELLLLPIVVSRVEKTLLDQKLQPGMRRHQAMLQRKSRCIVAILIYSNIRIVLLHTEPQRHTQRQHRQRMEHLLLSQPVTIQLHDMHSTTHQL
jgi:hypothetical protein